MAHRSTRAKKTSALVQFETHRKRERQQNSGPGRGRTPSNRHPIPADAEVFEMPSGSPDRSDNKEMVFPTSKVPVICPESDGRQIFNGPEVHLVESGSTTAVPKTADPITLMWPTLRDGLPQSLGPPSTPQMGKPRKFMGGGRDANDWLTDYEDVSQQLVGPAKNESIDGTDRRHTPEWDTAQPSRGRDRSWKGRNVVVLVVMAPKVLFYI